MSNESDGNTLFPMPEPISVEPKIKPLSAPVWTANKARLIARYLYYFVLVTKHGTYIDGFAGPQEPSNSETWGCKACLGKRTTTIAAFSFFRFRSRTDPTFVCSERSPTATKAYTTPRKAGMGGTEADCHYP